MPRVTPIDEKQSCTRTGAPSGRCTRHRRSSDTRPVVVLAVDVEQVERPGPRRPGRRGVVAHQLDRVVHPCHRDVPLEVVAGATAAEQAAVDEGVDRDEPAPARAERVREHDGGAAAVAADLHRDGPGRQRPGLLVEQRGLTLGEPAGNAVGERPDVGEPALGGRKEVVGHCGPIGRERPRGRPRGGAARRPGRDQSAGHGAPATTSVTHMPPAATSVTRARTVPCRAVTTNVVCPTPDGTATACS